MSRFKENASAWYYSFAGIVTLKAWSSLSPKYRVTKNVVLRLCGCCGGALDSIISVFTQTHKRCTIILGNPVRI